MRSLTIFLLLLYAFNASSQVGGTVQGESGPLAAATVRAGRQVVQTDSSGRFSFSGLQFPVLLQVSMVGYEPWQQRLTGGNDTMLVQLEQKGTGLEEVVVTGTAKPVQRLQSPIAVEVYSAQFFKKNPSPSIFEALQGVNGVRPQINCSVCNTGDIHINGLEGPYTMVTLDGMPIVSSLSSVYGLFGIPSQLIDRVEIVKGPASGLYGSEAIGGLINIITKTPEKAPRIAANVMSTNWGEHTVDLGFGLKPSSSVSTMLGVHYFNYARPIDKNGDNFTDVTLQHRASLFNKWSFARKKNRQLSIAARYYWEERWGGEMQWERKFRGSDSIYGESITTKRGELIGQYQLPVKPAIYLSSSATIHDQDSYYGITPYKGLQKIFFNQLRWEHKAGARHDLLLGLAARYNYYDDNSTATIDTATGINRPERVWIPGFFIQDEWKLHADHSMLLGARVDHHPAHGLIYTPRIAYKWGINEKQVFRVNAGTGFRVVNLFTEDHAALTGARAVEIKEALKPERSYNINTNYMNRIGSKHKYLLVDLSAWYTYFHNQIIADYDTDPQKIVYDNLDGFATSRGITVNLEFNFLQRLKGNAGITLQDVKKTEYENGRRETERPKFTESWSGTWQLSYQFPLQGITLDYTGNIYGPMDLPLLSPTDPRQRRSPVWSIQNIQLSKWMQKGWELYAGVKNLLNWTPARNNPFLIARAHDPFDKNVSYDANGNIEATPQNPYALSFDPTYIYAPNQGIRFFAGIRYQLR